jgi:hypothetical protein
MGFRRRGDFSLTIALVASLLVHGLILFVLATHYVVVIGQGIWQPAIPRPSETADEKPPIFIRRPELPDTANEMGESTGKGWASNSYRLGDETMRARESPEDQAYLSLDPVGLGGAGGADANEVVTPPAADTVVALASMTAPPTDLPAPFGIGATRDDTVAPVIATLAERARQQKQNLPAGDPAPQSDSESDPFTKIGSVVFRAGTIEARFGRKVKTIRPRLTLAGQVDVLALEYPTLQLKVAIDETGKVVSVDVIRSSGSNEIDLPCQRAMYDWWIEPAKGADGKPMADVMVWDMAFR